jgi:hypothetical protein
MKATKQQLLSRLKFLAKEMNRHYARAAIKAVIRKKSWNRNKRLSKLAYLHIFLYQKIIENYNYLK